MKVLKFTTILTVSFFSAIQMFAGGYTTTGQSAKIIGIGGAGTSYIRDASAVYYNPGAIATLEKNMVSGGFILDMSKSSFINTRYMNEQANMTGGLFMPFNLYGTYKIDEKIAVGLGINTPFGRGSKWEDDWEGRYVVQEHRLKTLYIQPTGSYFINEKLSVGLGIVIANSSIFYKNVMPLGDVSAEYKDSDLGFGFNIGVYGKIGSYSSYGISYKSAIQMKYKGNATFSNVPVSVENMYQQKQFTSELRLPSILSISVTDKITELIYLTYEFNLTSWSAVDSLVFDFENNKLDKRIGREYEDAMSFKVGAEYLFKENITIRAGVYYDETPVRDDHLSPIYPDGNELGFSLGGTYKLNEKIDIDAALLYGNQGKRKSIDNQTQFDGTFKTVRYSFSAGLTYAF